MLKKDEFIVVSDEEAGAVWMPECGGLKATTPEHARAIESYKPHIGRGEGHVSFQSSVISDAMCVNDNGYIPLLTAVLQKHIAQLCRNNNLVMHLFYLFVTFYQRQTCGMRR